MNIQTLEIIKKYSVAQYSRSKDPLHDISHVERVVKNAIKIVDALCLRNTLDLNLLIACCYLHDVVIVQQNNNNFFQRAKNHVFEPYLNKKFLPKILNQFDLSKDERSVILRAIVNHPHSIPYRKLNKKGDWYTKILQDADTWDYVSREREIRAFEAGGIFIQPLLKIYFNCMRIAIKAFFNNPQLHKSLLGI